METRRRSFFSSDSGGLCRDERKRKRRRKQQKKHCWNEDEILLRIKAQTHSERHLRSPSYGRRRLSTLR